MKQPHKITGMVPMLVVPLEKTLSAPDVGVKYKALTETKKIIEFLDKSCTVISKMKTMSHAPAPGAFSAYLPL